MTMQMDANLYSQADMPVGTVVGEISPEFAPVPERVGEPPAVLLRGVSKRFNDIYALRDTSITIGRGDVFGLLGPSGSGKSTLVRLLLGFVQPDEGTVSVFGSSDPESVKARIGYMPERPHFHHNFTGRDYLLFQARLSGLTRSGTRRIVERTIEAVGLEPMARRRIRLYERETIQRLALAVALVSIAGGEPGLLLLDEPSDNLSRAMQLMVRDIIVEQRQRGVTVLIASHRITEVERVSTSVGILRGGRLMTQTFVENNPRIIIVSAPRDGALDSYERLLLHLRNLHPFVTITGGGNGTTPLVVSLPSGPHIVNAAGIKASALRALVDEGWDVISVYMERKDLESIYVQTEPPRPQMAPGMPTGPLPNLTGPLSNWTGPLPPLPTRSLSNVTGPLSNSEGALPNPTGVSGALTGPLPNVTGPLGHYSSAHGSMNTLPLSIRQSAHNTRPLNTQEVNPPESMGDQASRNGHQPIEGRIPRREEIQ